MPELPEVEIFKRFIEHHALNQPIESVSIQHPKGLRGLEPEAFQALTINSQFVETQRRGKHVLVRLEPTLNPVPAYPKPWLLFHFGMTGCMSYAPPQQAVFNAYGDDLNREPHIRVSFNLANGGRLHFHDQRLFGYISAISDPAEYFQAKKLGPDALNVGKDEFLKQLANRKGAIKPVLMDQSVVAGLGNIYVDELLFQAGLHPSHPVSQLPLTLQNELHRLMQDILNRAVALKVDRDQLPEGYLWHQRQAKGQCPRDGQPLAIQTIGGRTTYFCPKCQH